MKTASSVTLADIAARAGVSPSTVSHVLNDRQSDRFSADTIERIRTLARELGYRTRQARTDEFNRRSQQHNSIAFVHSRQFTSVAKSRMFHVYVEAIEALQTSARAAGYQLTLETGLSDVASQTDFLHRSGDGAIKGWVVAGSIDPQTLALLHARHLPAVFIGDQVLDAECGSIVCSDNTLGAYQLTRLAIDKGHRRIAFVGCCGASRFYRLRCNGYFEALLEAGAVVDTNLICDPDSSPGGLEAFVEKQCRASDGATCIVAGSERLACDILSILDRREVRVPDEMSLVAFDTGPAFAATDPPVTCAGASGTAIGQAAFRRLLDLIDNPRTPPSTMLVPTEVVYRHSLAAPSDHRPGA